MDFFSHQEQAQRATTRLIWLFALAVAGMILTVYMGVALWFWHQPLSEESLWMPDVFVMVSLGVLAVVSLGTLYKMFQLKGGGAVVAENLGGRLLNHSQADLREKQLLNVVEEMAIASGVPVPPVYLLDQEEGINAFAAGYSPGDAVIGVTKGCMLQLTRDQLQGVMAHEFSHILNGDMRLNLRLMGVIHGILLLGIIGYYVMRTAMYSRLGGRRSKDNSAFLFVIAGLGLMAVGFLGTFFGNMIKAAVSRQREFLADSSAVQFTRNPAGIAGALKVIGGFKGGTELKHPHAPEASHMFFGQGVGFSALFATHPPIKERIQRIDPSWQGTYTNNGSPKPRQQTTEGPLSGFSSSPSVAVGSKVAQQVGAPNSNHLKYAHVVRQAIPDTLAQAAYDLHGARALIYALLLNKEPNARQTQLKRLRKYADHGVHDATAALMPESARLDIRCRLPLIDMALPMLRELSTAQYHRFAANVEELVKADNKMSLFEWSLRRILLHHLTPRYIPKRTQDATIETLEAAEHSVRQLLSTLAYIGHEDDDKTAAKALERTGFKILAKQECGLSVMDEALDGCNQLTPSAKRSLIEACMDCISHDGRVTVREAELFRAVADALGCPVPPLLPGDLP